jgi:hypothetical protein
MKPLTLKHALVEHQVERAVVYMARSVGVHILM